MQIHHLATLLVFLSWQIPIGMFFSTAKNDFVILLRLKKQKSSIFDKGNIFGAEINLSDPSIGKSKGIGKAEKNRLQSLGER
jgi:hypothetical protein